MSVGVIAFLNLFGSSLNGDVHLHICMVNRVAGGRWSPVQRTFVVTCKRRTRTDQRAALCNRTGHASEVTNDRSEAARWTSVLLSLTNTPIQPFPAVPLSDRFGALQISATSLLAIFGTKVSGLPRCDLQRRST